jgi:hypothetical protein
MKNHTILIGSILILALSLVCYAQYTGSELERKRPENLYPEPGPGDLLIVDQLKATNVQLQEQTRLLMEQNRILSETLAQMKKQQQPPVVTGH